MFSKVQKYVFPREDQILCWTEATKLFYVRYNLSLLLKSKICGSELGQGDLAIFVMGGSGRVEIMVKINYSDTAGQYKEGKSGESVKYGSE